MVESYLSIAGFLGVCGLVQNSPETQRQSYSPAAWQHVHLPGITQPGSTGTGWRNYVRSG
jgi:hypothetical protein